MSIIGEIKDQEIDDLRQQHKIDLERFAEWIAEEKWVYDGFKIWKKELYSGPLSGEPEEPKEDFVNTTQLVQLFLKDERSKRRDTSPSQEGLA